MPDHPVSHRLDERGSADVVYLNGKVITVDREFRIVQAVATKGERILAVGTTAEIENLVGSLTRIVDLAGQTVLPGLIDTHAHVELAGLEKALVSFEGVTNIEDALARIAARAAVTPPGQWIRGGTWHPIAQLAEKRFIFRDELDRVTIDHPICLPVSHFTLVNSTALKLAGIDKGTPDPDGGIIHRDANTGEPNGLLEERAEDLVNDLLPNWTDEEQLQHVRDSMAYFNSFGITSAISAKVDPPTFRAHQHICARKEATLRLSCMFSPTGGLNPTMSIEEWAVFFSSIGAMSDFGDDWLSYSGVKMQVDGGMTLRTAAMRDGYPDDPEYHGTIVVDPDRFDALVAIANRYGWRVGVHAVGDAAVDRVLDAYAKADAERSIKGRRFIIIHGSLIQRDQMERARSLGVRVDVQSCFLWDKAATVRRYLGAYNSDRAFPLRSLIDTVGLDNVAQGTDYPINTLNPFINMYVSITRRDKNGDTYGAEEAISREEAIRLYTSAAARYAFMENETGSIEAGKLADMIVISDDVLTIPIEELKTVTVLRTIVAGRQVYEVTG